MGYCGRHCLQCSLTEKKIGGDKSGEHGRPQKKKCFWLGDKPLTHRFFHFLVTGKIAASQNISNRWQKQPDQDYTEDTPTAQSSVGWSFQQCGRQCVDEHCCASLQHFSTTVLGVWFKLLISTSAEIFHYNGHCLLQCPTSGSVPKLALVHPKRVNITFPTDGWVLNFFLPGDVECFQSIRQHLLSRA
jgi:hypothetical protein